MTRTFLQSVKRFLEPVKPVSLYVKSIAMAVMNNAYWIYSIVLLQTITASIESGNESSFRTQLIVFSVLTIVFYSLSFLLRHKEAWPALYFKTIRNAHRVYMERFISLDNNKAERIGTGRIISIIDRGFTSWSTLIVTSIETGTRVIMALVFASYMIFCLSLWYLL